MPRKGFKFCRFCRKLTASGVPEKDPAKRHCANHSPQAMLQTLNAQEARRNSLGFTGKKPTKVKKRTQRNPFSISLICVFKSYELIRNPITHDVDRCVQSSQICAKHAPRRHRGDRSQPRFPNRFGEPLCPEHAIHANDEWAFPGEAPRVLSELEEEQNKLLEHITHEYAET